MKPHLRVAELAGLLVCPISQPFDLFLKRAPTLLLLADLVRELGFPLARRPRRRKPASPGRAAARASILELALELFDHFDALERVLLVLFALGLEPAVGDLELHVLILERRVRLRRLLLEPEREKVDLELEVKDLAVFLVKGLERTSG